MPRAVLIAIILLWGTPVNAEVTYKDYERLKNEPGFEDYIAGVGKGYFWANIYLALEDQHPLCCQPKKLALNSRNYWEVLDRYLSKKNVDESFSVEMLLLAP